MSLIARVCRNYTDVPRKGHFCVNPSTELWSEMVRLGAKLVELHQYRCPGWKSLAWKQLFNAL